MNQKQNIPQQHQSQPQTIPHQLRQSPVEIGASKSDTTQQKPLTLTEHLDGALNFLADSLFGGSGESPANPQSDNTSQDSSQNLFAQALKKEQGKNAELHSEIKQQQHLAQHKEMQMREVFDLEKKQTQETIKQIKQELELLIKEIKMVDKSVQTAVFQEETNPGTYHVNFFVKLRNFLILLRKRVREGATWAQTWNTKKYKSHYQQNSAKYGSKYMYGQEGQGLTRQSG